MTEPVPVDQPVRRRRRWPIVVTVLVVVIAATAGTIWIARDDAPRVVRSTEPAPPQPDLHWVLGAVPEDWVEFAAGDSYPGEFAFSWLLDGSYQTAMYGTEDDPSAPAMILAVGDRLNADGMSGYATREMTRWSDGDSTGICGTGPTGIRVCMVETDGTTVQSHSAGLSPEDVQAALMTLQVRDGMPEVDVAALPAGVQHLGSWRNVMPQPVGISDGHSAVSVVQYKAQDGQFAILTVGRDDEQDLASAFDLGLTKGVTVDGITYFRVLSESGEVEWVVWRQDGLAFQLMVHATETDGLALARGVRPAETDEWAAAVTATLPQFSPGTPASTTPQPPMPTMAPPPPSVTDVPVTLTAVERSGAGGIEISSTAPDGVPLTFLYGPDSIAVGVDGQFQTYGLDGGLPQRLEAARSTESWGAYIVTSDPRVWALRLTRANGERYTGELVPFPGRDDLRVAAIVVPVNEFVGADLVDEFGKVLDELGLPAE